MVETTTHGSPTPTALANGDAMSGKRSFIKADMNLVRGIHASSIKGELIDTMQRFSESTGITLVAEGVESSEELGALVDVGVRCAQGFLFARPGAPAPSPDWALVPDKE